MFNVFLTIFLAVCFLMTWASLGALSIEFKKHQESYAKFNGEVVNLFKQIHSLHESWAKAEKTLNDTLNTFDEHLLNYSMAIDEIHAKVIEIEQNTKKKSTKTKKESKKEENTNA